MAETAERTDAWDPAQYLRFAGHRLRPALDLLNRIDLERPEAVTDLGCGAGNVTRWLAQRWPDAAVTGIDGSAAMLAKAADALPEVRWRQADIAAWTPERPQQLIFSNAALHWLPDHETLFPKLAGALAEGGVLAVQMPRNFAEPSHTAMADAAHDGPWIETLAPMLKPAPVHEPAFYHRLLAPLASAVDLWETTYFQVLEGENPVAEWTKGTWLKPLLDALDALDGDWRDGFEAAYRARVAAAYPPGPDGRTLFPFRRLFMVARR